MAGMLSYAAAGLAQGLGQGIAQRGKAKREAKLREIQHQREMQRDERQFERRSELVDKRLGARRKQDERAWDRKKGQIVDTYQGENGMVGIRADGTTTTDLPGAKTEPKQPKLYDIYDEETGRKRKAVWDSETGGFVPVGGTAASNDDLGAKEKEIETLVNRGVPRERAENIAYGNERIETDPVTGNSYTVNVIDGTARRLNYDDKSGSNEQSSTNPMTPRSQRQPSGTNQNGGGASAAGQAQAGANREVARVAQEEKATLWNSVEGVPGASGAITEAYSRVGGQIGLGEGEETQETVSNRQYFRLAQNDLIRSLSLNPRFPVGEINRIQKETDIEPRIFDSEQSLRGRMERLDSVLRTRLQQERQAANNRDLPVQTRQNASTAAKDISNFLEILGVPQDSNSGSLNVDRIKNMSTRELDNLDASTMTTPQLEAATQRYEELTGGGGQ